MTKPKTRITLQALDAVEIAKPVVIPDADPPGDQPGPGDRPATGAVTAVRDTGELSEPPPGVSPETAALLGIELPSPDPAPPPTLPESSPAAAAPAPRPAAAPRRPVWPWLAAGIAAAAAVWAIRRPPPLDATTFAPVAVSAPDALDSETVLAFRALPDPIVAAPPAADVRTPAAPARRPARPRRTGDLF